MAGNAEVIECRSTSAPMPSSRSRRRESKRRSTKTWKLAWISACAAMTIAWVGLSSSHAQPPPTRIVSLNLCTDQLLLALAPERIAAISVLATDPLLSTVADEAKRYPRVSADAEDVLGHRPDLVVATPFAATLTLDLLRRLGRRVLIVEPALDLDGLRRTLRSLGGEIGAKEKAEAVIAQLDRDLMNAQRVGATSARRPSAIIINFGGVPSGPGTLADNLLTMAGYRNAVPDYPSDHRGAIPLEALVARPPDLLVLGQNPDDYHSIQGDNLRHPAMRALLQRVPNLRLPQRLTLCATPHIVEAVKLLASPSAPTASVGARP